ncbi:MAG: M48 family metalloprotease [Treponema sp.]|nr:M48 family metalloprotease [Treponema sp.]
MRKYIFLLVILFSAGSLVFSQTGNTRYIAVQSADLKSSTGFFARVVGRLSLGDSVTLISDDGRWSNVRSGNITGWMQSTNLSTRRIIASGSSSAGASEVALAGKGFSPATELEYKKEGLNFTVVDSMERMLVSVDELQRFITDGRLNSGDAPAAASRTSNPFGSSTSSSSNPFGASSSSSSNPFGASSSSSSNTFGAVSASSTSSADDEFTLVDTYYLGRAVAANILSTYRPYTQNQNMLNYLNRICQTLVINSFGPPTYSGYFVMILDNNDPYAFATPGGHIFISRGLIQAITSEDILAALIAHELSHIMLKHGVSLISDMKLYNEMSAMADQAAGMAAGMAAAAGRNTAAIQQTLSFRDSISKMAETLMVSGYAQPQEFDADREAMSLLSKAGYDPRALIDLLRILQRFPGGQRGGLLSTHPSPADRIANAERYAASYSSTNTRQSRVSRFTNRL